jgi:hypothetical protein
MSKTNTHLKSIVFIALAGAIGGSLMYGCTSSANTATTQNAGASGEPTFALFGPPPHKTGVQLWSDNCARCHNSRPPEEFSDAQWETIVHHMRLRANLTGEESREIVKFLQASN